jgi:hypothetical protein
MQMTIHAYMGICQVALRFCIDRDFRTNGRSSAQFVKIEGVAQAPSTLALLLLVLWITAPAVRCLVPGEALTAAEQACCKSMAGQCGDSPALDHPCCKHTTSSAQPAVVPVQVSTVPTIAVCALQSTSIPARLLQEFASEWLVDPSPPPRAAQLSSILRI